MLVVLSLEDSLRLLNVCAAAIAATQTHRRGQLEIMTAVFSY